MLPVLSFSALYLACVESTDFQILKNEIYLFVGQVDINASGINSAESCIMEVLHLS